MAMYFLRFRLRLLFVAAAMIHRAVWLQVRSPSGPGGYEAEPVFSVLFYLGAGLLIAAVFSTLEDSSALRTGCAVAVAAPYCLYVADVVRHFGDQWWVRFGGTGGDLLLIVILVAFAWGRTMPKP